MNEELQALQAENDRLREGLERIRDYPRASSMLNALAEIRDIAFTYLAPPQPEMVEEVVTRWVVMDITGTVGTYRHEQLLLDPKSVQKSLTITRIVPAPRKINRREQLSVGGGKAHIPDSFPRECKFFAEWEEDAP
jgi:hypothetical protein